MAGRPEFALAGCDRLTGALLRELTGARVEAGSGPRGLPGTLRELAAAWAGPLGGCARALLPGELTRLRAGSGQRLTRTSLQRELAGLCGGTRLMQRPLQRELTRPRRTGLIRALLRELT
ncbi:hypothetical protein [Nocardia asteroides]|uniref:hypothetical protein n=1 Tax=Nocardia asteroides TaxID=1824 RepID=UPI0036536A54